VLLKQHVRECGKNSYQWPFLPPHGSWGAPMFGRAGIVEPIANSQFCKQNFWPIRVELDLLPQLAHEDA
jgi:hypothetical protein